MAQGSIRKRQAADGPVRYDVTIDLGPDPLTGKRRQRRKTCIEQEGGANRPGGMVG